MRFPTYLIRRGGVFYYRAKVPVDLHHQLNRREVWISLRTSDRKSAELRLADAHFQQLRAYESLRHGGLAPAVELIAVSQTFFKPPKPDPGQSVDDLLEYWAKQSEKRPRTLLDAKTAVRRLKTVVGELFAAQLDKRHAVAFKDALLAEGLAHATTVKNLGLIKSIFDVASGNALIGTNPFKDIKFMKSVRQEKSRLPFTHQDLEKIFSSPVFTEAYRPMGGAGEAAYWLPLIALYSGMRLEEIGQLCHEDIKEEAGIWFFDLVHQPEKGKTLKNESSCRRVPIHPSLIHLGVLNLRSDEAALQSKRIFPRLASAGARQLTARGSQWFGRYLRLTVGITDKRKTFHSFRHTFKDACREAMIPKDVHDRLTGHTSSDVGDGYGGAHYPLKPLSLAIDSIKGLRSLEQGN